MWPPDNVNSEARSRVLERNSYEMSAPPAYVTLASIDFYLDMDFV